MNHRGSGVRLRLRLRGSGISGGCGGARRGCSQHLRSNGSRRYAACASAAAFSAQLPAFLAALRAVDAISGSRFVITFSCLAARLETARAPSDSSG